MMARIESNENFIKNVIFSDEATFMLNGYLNRHNCRFCEDESLDRMQETHTQYSEKINVWVGIVNNQIFRPLFIIENLICNNYHQLLVNEIVPVIEGRREENQYIWFQQDGAPPIMKETSAHI